MASAPDDEGKKKRNRQGGGGGFVFNESLNASTMNFINGDVENLTVHHQGLAADELKLLDELFRPVREQVQSAAQTNPNLVEQQVQDLHTELAKGKDASADRLNKIIDGLVDLVPGAVGALITMFADPILGGLVGPVTQQVLKRLQG